MKWLEVQVKTTPEYEDIVTDILYSSGATGLAIEDPNDIINLKQNETDWDFIDQSLIDLSSDSILIKAYFSEDNGLDQKIDQLRENIENNTNGSYGEVHITHVDDEDWSENWKKYYKPTKIGSRIVIKPSWEHYEPKDKDIIIELDPGMAFGTGTHESTIMCTEALDSYLKGSPQVFDIGCGSGILSIVAAKLGASKVISTDLDELCVKITKENVNINNVEDIVEVKQGNLLDSISGKANIIVANIIAEIIVDLTKEVREFLHPEGIYITSGIITEKIPMVERTLIENGFKILEIKQMKSWACIIASMI